MLRLRLHLRLAGNTLEPAGPSRGPVEGGEDAGDARAAAVRARRRLVAAHLARATRHAAAELRRGGGGCWLDEVDTKLYTSLISTLASQPRFLSVTFAQEDPPSLLLDKALLRTFGDALVGDTDGDLVPVFLDLADLPLGATGIVSGVAGRLLDHPDMARAEHPNEDDADLALAGELSYLSTARAGVVILPKEQAVKALEVLRPLLVEEQ